MVFEKIWNYFLPYVPYLPYLFLVLALLSLWIKRHLFIWGSLFVLAVIAGLYAGRVHIIALPFIIGLGILFYITFKTKFPLWLRILCGVLGVVLALLFGFHKIPGFSNIKVFSNIVFSESAAPYTLYLNFDKALVGLFILGLGWNYVNGFIRSINQQSNLTDSQKIGLSNIQQNNNIHFHPTCWLIFKIVIINLIMISLLALLALTTHYVRFDLKWTSLFWIWGAANLFFGCIPEEALFRGVIQNSLIKFFPKTILFSLLAIFITAILFGLAHFAFGLQFMLLSFIAGLFYGWVYFISKRIEASIITHFVVNATHFLFFSYPFLMNKF